DHGRGKRPALAAPDALSGRDRGGSRGLLCGGVGRSPGRDRRRRSRPPDRALSRGISASGARSSRAGTGADLPRARSRAAVPRRARDAYRLATVRRNDLLDTLCWPGTWRMLARWWKTGLTELRHAAVRGAFVRAAAQYVPALEVNDVEPSFAGVRAQALGRDGRLLEDFAFSRTDRALHVRNAPSPAATSSMAIARHIADEAASAFAIATPRGQHEGA